MVLYILFPKRFFHSKLISPLHFFLLSHFTIHMLWHCCSLLLQADKIDFIISFKRKKEFFMNSLRVHQASFALLILAHLLIFLLVKRLRCWHSTTFNDIAHHPQRAYAPTHFHLRSHQIRFSYFTELFNDDNDDENIEKECVSYHTWES